MQDISREKIFSSYIREYQEINYPILWGRHPCLPTHTGKDACTTIKFWDIFLFASPLNQKILGVLSRLTLFCQVPIFMTE